MTSNDQILDRDALFEQFDNDQEFLKDVAEGFFAGECRDLLSEVERAASENEPIRLAEAAHTFKGAIANFFAKDAVSCAKSLELKARGGDFSGALSELERLKKEVERLMEAVRKLY